MACFAKAKSPVTSVRPRPSKESSVAAVLVATMDGQAQLARLEKSSVADSSTLEIILSDAGIAKHEKLISCAAWSPCGNYFATASRDQSLHIYAFQIQNDASFTSDLIRSIKCSGSPEAIEFIECYGCLCLAVAVRDDHCLQYICVARNGPQARLDLGAAQRVNMNAKGDAFVSFAVLALAAAPCNMSMIAACTDKSRVIIFRAGSPQQYRNLYGHSSGEYANPVLAWDPSGRFLATNSEVDLAIHVWHVPTGDHVLRLEGHRQSIRDLYFYDSTRKENEGDNAHIGALVSASFDKTLRVWDQFLV
jgi:WD40 repeat protein